MHAAGPVPEDRDPERWPPAAALTQAVSDLGRSSGWDAAAALIREQWDRYAATAPQHLLEAISVLPGRVLLDKSDLVAGAISLRQATGETGSHRFDHDHGLAARPAAAASGLAEELILLTDAATNARTKGDVEHALQLAVQARHRLDAALRDAHQRREVGDITANLPHLLVQWGRSLEAADADDASREYEDAHHFALATNQSQIARRAAAHLAWHHAEHGRIRIAEEWLGKATTIGQKNPQYEAITHLAAALVLLEHGDRLSAGVELARARAYPTGEYWAGALWLRSLHATSPDEFALVATEVADETERHPPSTRGPVDARYLRATHLTIGLTPDAAPPTHPTKFDRLLDAVNAFARGAFEDTLQLAQHPGAATAIPRVRSTALLLSALAALALEWRPRAVEFFQRATAILDHEGLTTPYRMLPPDVLDYFSAATGRTITAEAGGEPAIIGMALSSLTPRERQILALLTTASPAKDIAAALFISPNTVKATTQRLYRKLNVTSRREAADLARRAGITPQP